MMHAARTKMTRSTTVTTTTTLRRAAARTRTRTRSTNVRMAMTNMTRAQNEENDTNVWNTDAMKSARSHKDALSHKYGDAWASGFPEEFSSVKLEGASRATFEDTKQWHLEHSASGRRPRPESSYTRPMQEKSSFRENSGRWRQHEAQMATRIDDMQRSRHLLLQQQQQQRGQREVGEGAAPQRREQLVHLASARRSEEAWTRPEFDDFSSRPYTNGGRTQSTRERAQALVERTTSEDLLAMLNEQRLDNLETKTRLTQEIKAKRDELKKREMELIDHEQALRRQHDMLQKEREGNQERQRQLESDRRHLQTKTKQLTREMEAMRKTVSRSEKEKFRAEDKLRQQVLERNQKINVLERDLDLLQGRLEIADAKVKTASHTEAALRQTNSSVVAELKALQHEQAKSYKQLELAREREAELEVAMSKTREERDRAEERASRAMRAADDSSRKLSTEQLRAAALEDDVRKLRHSSAPAAAAAAASLAATEGGLQLLDQGAARGPGRQEYLEMLAEVKRCLEEVQASKQANRALEERARRAEAEVAKLRKARAGRSDEAESTDAEDAGENVAQLRAALAQREKTLTQAEWDRIAAEQEAQQVREALQECRRELDAATKDLRETRQRGDETSEALDAARRAEAELRQKLEEATFKLDEMEASQEATLRSAATQKADETALVCEVVGAALQYLGAAKRLVALLYAFLEGEQPSMDVLLDDVEGDPDAAARFARCATSDRLAALRELQADLASGRESVLQVRSRIADNYAENLGSDCNVQ